MNQLDFPQSICQAGVARRDITPPVGIYHRMWGAAKHDRSTGVHRPLTATALALAPAESQSRQLGQPGKQLLIAIDHCLLWTNEMDALREAVAQAANLPLEEVHIACSHTHAAGLMDPARVALPGGDLIAGYLETLGQLASDAACEALDSIGPAWILYGQGRCGVARHRDFWDAENRLFACGLNPTGPSDDTVIVARIIGEEQQPLATVVNYACHPTTLAWDNTLISPDYVGALRELVEARAGGLCLFLQGASGDLGPRYGFVGEVAVADAHGRELGYAVLAALESLPKPEVRLEYAGPVVSGATIGTWNYRKLPTEAREAKAQWRGQQFQVPLALRADLPSLDETERQLADWQAEEERALLSGDTARARDARAQAERMARQRSRLTMAGPGPTLGLQVSLWQLGDALWVTLEGEHYQWLQRTLRTRWAGHPVIISTVTDGWRPGYLPTRETYGRGIYQESIALAAAGSLEQVTDAISAKIAAWLHA